MQIAGKFVSYEETEYVIDGKPVTGRLLNVNVDGALLSFKGSAITKELPKGFFEQFEVGEPLKLICKIKVREYNDLNGKKTKVPTLYIENIEA